MRSFSVVILAAGQGTRMKSALPKVLHPIGGIPLLKRIVTTVNSLAPKNIVVVHSQQSEKLKEALKTESNLSFALQSEQLGTGHAVLQAKNNVEECDQVLIVYGDVPLIREATLKKLLEVGKSSPIAFISAMVKNPKGFGRVLRNAQGQVTGVVEEKDASDFEKQINEINTGIFLVSREHLFRWLPQVKNDNVQKEYYLPAIIDLALKENLKVATVLAEEEYEILGVNDKVQLAELERIFQRLQAEQLMREGVHFFDPTRFDLRGTLQVGEDVSIDANVIIEGQVRIGNNVTIGPNVIIKHSEIHDGAKILANTLIEGAIVGPGATVGPFARLRPGTELSVNVHIGNFVEIKNAMVGPQSKVNHLSYIGDASLGQGVNVGAGTITCNYDGKTKHHTTIGDRVFIGSDTQLIAPVRVGSGATIGAGTTVVRDVEPNQLVHNRVEQRTVKNWAGRENEE